MHVPVCAIFEHSFPSGSPFLVAWLLGDPASVGITAMARFNASRLSDSFFFILRQAQGDTVGKSLHEHSYSAGSANDNPCPVCLSPRSLGTMHVSFFSSSSLHSNSVFRFQSMCVLDLGFDIALSPHPGSALYHILHKGTLRPFLFYKGYERLMRYRRVRRRACRGLDHGASLGIQFRLILILYTHVRPQICTTTCLQAL